VRLKRLKNNQLQSELKGLRVASKARLRVANAKAYDSEQSQDNHAHKNYCMSRQYDGWSAQGKAK
jgi:hypothetical protein